MMDVLEFCVSAEHGLSILLTLYKKEITLLNSMNIIDINASSVNGRSVGRQMTLAGRKPDKDATGATHRSTATVWDDSRQ